MTQKKISIPNEEQAMISSLEKSGYEAIENQAAEIQRLTALFKESGSKAKRVNIRMTTRDVEKAQALAMREGIPYATLLTKILHLYLTGQLRKI